MKKIKTTIAMIVFTIGFCIVALVFAVIWFASHVAQQLTAKAMGPERSSDRPLVLNHESESSPHSIY